ncbi:GDSL-type esterase/lipase family protein [Geobacillus stearothermophilus]|uniref:SGNH/GDSL hydrolase family protein n=1 Tax=Geobacillus stearothermophilus TaxID=1422 RepID=UPI002E1B95C5|nr:GDSL-type esterase/lipase family protein [Geobacillus stearothermophilus]MED4830616.1 GDSL-type esterase/lipase family protein [Geobacillus stearothermophilus]MED4960338.1 GDSL-type esterase/lipase family protein [Geobacillus stearothermophilus]
MAVNRTPNLGLHDWLGTEYVKREEIVENFRKIDNEFGASGRVGDLSNKIGILNDTTMKQYEQFINALGFLKQDGSVVIIGDSITEGYGLPYYDQYVTKLFNILKNANGYPNDFEVNTNFSADQTIQINGSYSIGTKGASKKSLILQPGATITFTGNVQYIDLIFDKTPTSGSIEVYRDGILYKTINCSGPSNPYAHSFASTPSNHFNTATHTLKCVDSPVEILGLIRLQAKPRRGGINLIRCGVSGENTAYFSDDVTLEYIKHVTDYAGNPNKLYIIALGTNDIYNPKKAIPTSQYQANLEKMIQKLSDTSNDVRIVLTVPPISHEDVWPAILEPYGLYRKAVYELSQKYNLSVIDYSYLFFTENNWYQDGVHPNANGSTQMVNHITKSLAMGVSKTRVKTDWIRPTLMGNWVSIGNEYGTVAYKREGDMVTIRGVVQGGSPVFDQIVFRLDPSCWPSTRRVIRTANDQNGATLVIQEDGYIRFLNGSPNWNSLDCSFSI